MEVYGNTYAKPNAEGCLRGDFEGSLCEYTSRFQLLALVSPSCLREQPTPV